MSFPSFHSIYPLLLIPLLLRPGEQKKPAGLTGESEQSTDHMRPSRTAHPRPKLIYLQQVS